MTKYQWPMPRTVKVLGQKVTVRKAKDAAHDVSAGDNLDGEADRNDDRVGSASLRFGRIGVDSRQSPDQLADTFLHENLHLMLMHAACDDEDVVVRLAPILLDWLRTNPRAVQYLTQRRLVTW